jgi:NADPH2:quinone reductase
MSHSSGCGRPFLDATAAGQLSFPVDRVYDGLEQVRQAHDDMEHDRATGKLVVRVRL